MLEQQSQVAALKCSFTYFPYLALASSKSHFHPGPSGAHDAAGIAVSECIRVALLLAPTLTCDVPGCGVLCACVLQVTSVFIHLVPSVVSMLALSTISWIDWQTTYTCRCMLVDSLSPC